MCMDTSRLFDVNPVSEVTGRPITPDLSRNRKSQIL
jgi:hypothetical protein